MRKPIKLAPTKKRVVCCAIYPRVSTDDQARGEYSSLESQ